MNRLTIDLDLQRAITSLQDDSLFTDTIPLKGGNQESFEIQFVQHLDGVDPTIDAITIGLKIKTALSGAYDASTSSFVKTGSGATAIYTFDLSLDTAELRAEFASKSEPASLPMYLEVVWTSSGVVSHTQLINLSVENALNRGTEASSSANSQLSILADGATVTWPAPNALNVAKVTLGGNRTLAITGAKPGTIGSLIVVQDGTGSRTLTLPAGSKTNGGGGISLTGAAGAIDLLNYVYDGTSFYWTHFNNYL